MRVESRVAWFLGLLLLAPAPLAAQARPVAAAEPAVSGYAALYLGLTADEETVPIGMVGLDHRAWHFLARYGYEDKDTFSGWVGRIFQTGDRVALSVTPMAGLVLGLTDGAAPGLEFELTWGRLTLYNESELLIPFDGSASYFYAWGNTSFRVKDWFQPGVSIQRLRVFESERTVDRGFSLTAEFGPLATTLYGYNPFTSDRFYQLALEWSF